VELAEQAAYPVGGAGGLGGEVLVKADEHGQLGGDLVSEFQERRVWGMVGRRPR
jgi:GTPase involved in cell partitioning and DNA repair